MTSEEQQPPQPQTTVRKLVVEVIEARDLLPKDGQGSSSPYVVADFDGQKKRTLTIHRNLNPVWNEPLEFIVSDPKTMEFEELNVEVLNDKKLTNGNGRKNHFLGRVKLYGSQFVKRGEEGLVYFTLEKKSVFSWIRGELGLKIYYDDVVENPPENQEQPQPQQDENPQPQPPPPQPEQNHHDHRQQQFQPAPEEVMKKPVLVEMDENPPPHIASDPHRVHQHHHPPPIHSPRILRNMHMGPANGVPDRPKVLRRPVNGGDFSPRIIRGEARGHSERIQPMDLVEPMQYLFVRIVKARDLSQPNDHPQVRIRSSNHVLRSKPANNPSPNPEWNQVFALAYNKDSTANSTLEISVWDGVDSDKLLGGVCFDLSDVPVRDPPDSPLAPQWYHLDGGEGVTGDLQLSVWIGTQADDAFPESSGTDAPQQAVSYTRPKVYQSPKMWYLRLTVIEAQDIPVGIIPNMPPEIRVKAQLGFQSLRTRRGIMSRHLAAFHWNEDLVFVAGEPLEDNLILLVEDRTGKDPVLLGHVLIPVGSIEQRIDERHVAAKWHSMEGGPGGRLHLRLCLEGGYHVLDEAAHLCSDFRPTAKQLWKPPVGVLELGILGARGLSPMKPKAEGGGGSSSTDAYCVAKYGKKWVRTRTVTDSFDPRWNEQYTWQVYDPCTVLTIGVFDNCRMFIDPSLDDRPDHIVGKVRIRVSTLDSNKVYMNSYPLVVLSRAGLRKMGEIELAVRFACPSLLPDTCGVYGQPLLPRMHYVRPLGVAQQEVLRAAATKMVAAWLARSEPPLGPEVVHYMLDASSNSWSMRKSKCNWARVVAVLAWAVGLARWLDHIRRWRSPITTVLVHILYLVLVWYPDLIVPTGVLYVFLIGIWYYRFKPKIPAGMDVKLSLADIVDPEELDEEFDTFPSSRPPDVVRARYDRLRVLAARVQTVLGDFATQGERIQALVSWRDPRATKLFLGACFAITVILYVVPPKMVAVALGFYFLRHPMFRDPMPPASLSFFRRLPGLSDRLL